MIEKAKEMVGNRICAACYARAVDQDHYRQGGEHAAGDMRGRHWTFEPPRHGTG